MDDAIPNKINALLCILTLIINFAALIFTPLLTQNSGVLIGVCLLDILVLRVTNLHWHLLHEAAHGMLFSNKRCNEWMGTTLGLLLLSAFSLLRFGHLNHHRTNRYGDTTEVYFQKLHPGKITYYTDLLGGFFSNTNGFP